MPTGTSKEEVKTNISLNNSAQVVTPITSQSQQGIEPVTEVVTPAVTEVVTPQIDWQSYPYQSKDIYTLKNRANKVKERVLGCTTNNELINLLAKGKASDAEIKWLALNLLSESEVLQLESIQNTRQGNLFNSNDSHSKTKDSDCRELQIGARVMVKSRKTEAKVIAQDIESKLYQIAYLNSECKTWEGWANLTYID